MPLYWQYTCYTKIWPLPACVICFLVTFIYKLLFEYRYLQGSVLWESASNELLLSTGGRESQFGGRHSRKVCRTDAAGLQNYGGSSLVSHFSVIHLIGGSKLPTFMLYDNFWNIYAVI